MDAKVKKESRYGSITAFSGLEFIRTEWRPVPAGLEDEARRNPFLELQDPPQPEPAPKGPENEPDTKPEAMKRRKGA